MESGFERMLSRAATIDEVLSDAYQPLPGQKADADIAAHRLAAWCRAAASGDWRLFARRLDRDGWSVEEILTRFANVRRDPRRPVPAWMADGEWVCAALQPAEGDAPVEVGAVPFAPLFAPLVSAAQMRLWSVVDPKARGILTEGARADLSTALMCELSDLASPALFERFTAATGFRDFVGDMAGGGFRRLFEDKPVLLRLLASVTRQWIDSSRELIDRLTDDLPVIRRTFAAANPQCRVTRIVGGLSDPHNFGRTVRIVGFGDGARVVYKPKHLDVDAAWAALVERLNSREPPADLRAMRVLTRAGYGWTEFIEHTSCDGPEDFSYFFRRAGAWLALFHAFVGVDMHQENIVATGSHPVPIDLEMILQSADARIADSEDTALATAMRKVLDSVVTVGLLPAYGRHSTSRVFVIGGVHSDSSPRVALRWMDANTDAMRPVKVTDIVSSMANLPFSEAGRASLADHLDDLISGFGDYAAFLHAQSPQDLLADFGALPIRTVIRPTRFYTGLLARLRDHRSMDDGVTWSAQADFAARLADWDTEVDPLWPLQRAERAALVDLNVPHFTTTGEGHTLGDAAGTSIRIDTSPGLERAGNRLRGLTDEEIAWQIEVIRQNTDLLRHRPAVGEIVPPPDLDHHGEAEFRAEADALAVELGRLAVRGSTDAAWIGLDWLGESEVSQLVVLGPDLYNGNCGIALFLAAHSAMTGDASSEALARAAVAGLRKNLVSRNPARLARSLGVGGGLGLGSIVYGLAVIAELLRDDAILGDAHICAALMTDDVIAADNQLDILGGSAGAILGLLRLHRQTGDGDALRIAEKCGQALLARPRVGQPGARTWVSPAFGRPLNGISHGAAGYAYSMSALSAATGSDEFCSPTTECLAYEDSTYDSGQRGWADLRDGADATSPCKWCYGAPGIGLARIAMTRLAGQPPRTADIERAADCVEHHWPVSTDTLCCGTLGSVEFLWEAAGMLGREDLRRLATRRLLSVVGAAHVAGDYRFSSGTGKFNLGLFRGLAGIGYTMLRGVHPTLPNVLIWE
ncbi:type 2 lantibiotic biosynthesis protein LanM [Mycolicibacterium rhodesiae NBB3]|uniref:Type 2 lantibiotic biosynthesis protein LanM n=1 Tax=Mycolicibacterium rhodesiae (strain NBB3) TaxID=710685 RepID=G8RHV4_MYCRN|nr:type 2 lanthipeptide synthetase LanM family protein [Mycolicibacterium rhodesiae]AEV72104.1 type 2 lantibiotic biosynthesis protein LanM [Mycolicibacterium rhodesiae NBB3]